MYALLKMFAVWTKGIIKTDSKITLFGQTLPLAAMETWLTEGPTSKDHINGNSHDIQTYWGGSSGIQLAPNKSLWSASILTIQSAYFMTKHFNWWVLSSVQASIEMKSQAIIFDVTQ